MSDKQMTLANDTVVQNKQEITEPSIMMLAQNPDFPVEKLQMLIDMKNREEDRAAKRDFDFHFAEMQRDFKPVEKTKAGSVTDNGKVAFYYAPIEYFQEVNGEAITNHGFSYKWTEEPLPEGALRVRIHISGYGYTDSNTFTDVPPIATNRLTTPAQARGAQKGYGRRITFVDGFGMTAIGEDTDGRLSIDETLEYADDIKALNNCQTPEVLHAKVQEVAARMKAAGDDIGREVIRKYYASRKAELKRGKA